MQAPALESCPIPSPLRRPTLRLAVVCAFWAYGISLSTLLYRHWTSSDSFIRDFLHLLDSGIGFFALMFTAAFALGLCWEFHQQRSRTAQAPALSDDVLEQWRHEIHLFASLGFLHLVAGPVIWFERLFPAWEKAYTTHHAGSPGALALFTTTWLPASVMGLGAILLSWVTLRQQEAISSPIEGTR